MWNSESLAVVYVFTHGKKLVSRHKFKTKDEAEKFAREKMKDENIKYLVCKTNCVLQRS